MWAFVQKKRKSFANILPLPSQARVIFVNKKAATAMHKIFVDCCMFYSVCPSFARIELLSSVRIRCWSAIAKPHITSTNLATFFQMGLGDALPVSPDFASLCIHYWFVPLESAVVARSLLRVINWKKKSKWWVEAAVASLVRAAAAFLSHRHGLNCNSHPERQSKKRRVGVHGLEIFSGK